jgi:hypothetical protein
MFRHRGTRSNLLAAVANLLCAVGAAAAILAQAFGLMWSDPHAGTPDPEEAPGSGVVIRAEVTAIWLPRALRDLTRHEAGSPAVRSVEELQASMGRDCWRAGWYALTCRLYQADGRSSEITQLRRLSEAAEHLEELRAMLATAAGRPPRYEGVDFSHARVVVIPDELQAVDPREAITRLMSSPVVRDIPSPTGGLYPTHGTE